MAVTERIVSFLTEELVSQKHDVTLFASADSQTKPRLVTACESALRLCRQPVVDPIAHYVRLLELVFRQAHEFDILHFHIDYLHFSANAAATRANTTNSDYFGRSDKLPLARGFSAAPIQPWIQTSLRILTETSFVRHLGHPYPAAPARLPAFGQPGPPHYKSADRLPFLPRRCSLEFLFDL